jgi:hypothetical protein
MEKKASSMKYFLLVYERSSGKLLDQREYGPDEGAKALEERFARERARRNGSDVEIVVLGAESLEALKKTHSRYFMTLEEIMRDALKTA